MERNPLENHLFFPTKKEDEKHSEYLETMRKINDLLLSEERYIGISVHGSQIKGYSTERSDFDYEVFIEWMSGDERNKLEKMIREKTGNQKINIKFLPVHHFDEMIKEKKEGKYAELGWFFPQLGAALIFFLKPTIGKMNKIEKYRKEFKDVINESPDRQKYIEQALLYATDYQDLPRKANERLNLTGEENESLKEKRRMLWRQKIERFLKEED